MSQTTKTENSQTWCPRANRWLDVLGDDQRIKRAGTLTTSENQKHDSSLKSECEALNFNQNEARAYPKITQTNWWVDDLENFIATSEHPRNKRIEESTPKTQKQML
jgi:hypothetical protein